MAPIIWFIWSVRQAFQRTARPSHSQGGSSDSRNWPILPSGASEPLLRIFWAGAQQYTSRMAHIPLRLGFIVLAMDTLTGSPVEQELHRLLRSSSVFGTLYAARTRLCREVFRFGGLNSSTNSPTGLFHQDQMALEGFMGKRPYWDYTRRIMVYGPT